MTTIRVYDFDETLAYHPMAVYRLIFGEWGAEGFTAASVCGADLAHRRFFAARGEWDPQDASRVGPGDRECFYYNRVKTRAYLYRFPEYKQIRGHLEGRALWRFPAGERESGWPEWLPAIDDLKEAIVRGDYVAIVSSRLPVHTARLRSMIDRETGGEFPREEWRIKCTGTPDKGPAVAEVVRGFRQAHPDDSPRVVFHDDNPRSIESVRQTMAAAGVPCECIKYSRTNTGQIEDLPTTTTTTTTAQEHTQ